MAFSDGYTIVPLPAAQDHKRIGEGDTGPNTGGMGAYAPAPIATVEVIDRIVKEVLQPTINGMRKEGTRSLSSVMRSRVKRLDRLPLRGLAVYRTDDNCGWTQGPRV